MSSPHYPLPDRLLDDKAKTETSPLKLYIDAILRYYTKGRQPDPGTIYAVLKVVYRHRFGNYPATYSRYSDEMILSTAQGAGFINEVLPDDVDTQNEESAIYYCITILCIVKMFLLKNPNPENELRSLDFITYSGSINGQSYTGNSYGFTGTPTPQEFKEITQGAINLMPEGDLRTVLQNKLNSLN